MQIRYPCKKCLVQVTCQETCSPHQDYGKSTLIFVRYGAVILVVFCIVAIFFSLMGV